jgi:negative regulator of flagellin synthesis FlgM
MTKINPQPKRSLFFPKKKEDVHSKVENQSSDFVLKRNRPERQKEIENYIKGDTKVQIPEAVKDFSRIKRTVDMTPNPDNTQKISELKAKIKNGNYHIDYDALADKIIENEF